VIAMHRATRLRSMPIQAPRRKPGDRPTIRLQSPNRKPAAFFIKAPRRKPGDCPPFHLEAPPGKAGTAPLIRPRGFTLTELLVAVSIVLVLMGLIAAAVAAASTTRKANATRSIIAKLDAILTTQLSSYADRSVDLRSIPVEVSDVFKNKIAQRAWAIRRNMISSDLPDRWSDVQFMHAQSQLLKKDRKWDFGSASQRTYATIWQTASPKPSDVYAGAECLFMIVMQGGIADCIDCGSLTVSEIGDKDGDGFMEFLDGWGNPIGFILWPAALQLPGGSGRLFFDGARRRQSPFGEDLNGDNVLDPLAPGLGMRPVIYSAGPDGEYGLDRNSEAANVGSAADVYGVACGDWTKPPVDKSAAPDGFATDNITNFDDEAKK